MQNISLQPGFPFTENERKYTLHPAKVDVLIRNVTELFDAWGYDSMWQSLQSLMVAAVQSENIISRMYLQDLVVFEIELLKLLKAGEAIVEDMKQQEVRHDN